MKELQSLFSERAVLARRGTVDISVVIPVYNSEDCLPELARRLTDSLNRTGRSFEIILVNDCSPDKSWEAIEELTLKHPELHGLNLRRNFGQDCALMAGMNFSRGNYVVIMDDDLQHDPDDIPQLVEKLDEGWDICYAKFFTKRQTWFKNLGSWVNDKAANIVLRKPPEVYLSPYKAIRREVVDEIIRYDGPWPYVDGLLFRVTQKITQVMVEHHERFAGHGNYNLIRSMMVWSRLATNFSVFPLRIATFIGFTASGFGFLAAAYFVIKYFVAGTAPQGWYSTIVTILFLGGVQLVAIGIIGEYVGRMFLHHSHEPQFVVREVKSGSKEEQ